MNLTYSSLVYPADLRCFPELVQIIPVLPKENYKRNFFGEKAKELFIFEPWKKNKSSLRYPVNEAIQLRFPLIIQSSPFILSRVIISNPFDIDVFIDLLYFSVDGVETLSYPSNFLN